MPPNFAIMSENALQPAVKIHGHVMPQYSVFMNAFALNTLIYGFQDLLGRMVPILSLLTFKSSYDGVPD